MTTWRENDLREKFDKFLSETYPKEVWGLLDLSLILPFISQTLKEALDEVERKLPEKKYVMEHICNQKEWCLIPECNYNQCLADIKESIKKTKKKFLK